MSATTTEPAGATSPGTLALVRQNVRDLFQQSAAFQALPPEKQREIAHQTVQIASYLAEPEGIRADRLNALSNRCAFYQNPKPNH